MIYKIRDWETLFETCETKKLKKLHWVPTPNKHDGKSFRRIANMKNGCEIFTAWMLILQIASKCSPRGTLIDGNVPIGTEDMSLMTGFPEKLFIDALKVLSNGKIDWIEPVDSVESPVIAGDHPEVSGESPTEGRKEGNEENAILFQDLVNSWNSMESFPKCMAITDKRRKSMKTRLSEEFFIDNWKPAMERLKSSPFCQGKNDRGWKADIDWFLKPDSVPRIMEGKYDGKKEGVQVVNTDGSVMSSHNSFSGGTR